MAEDEKKEGIGAAPYLALLAGELADVGSTKYAQAHGAHEANPVLGDLSAAGLATKAGGALLTALLMRKLAQSGHPKIAKVLGYGSGAGLGAVAAQNVAGVK